MLQETNAGSIPLSGKKNSETIKPVSNNNTEEPTFASYIDILTKALYYIQRREGASLELDPAKFERMIEATNPQLKGFFNYIMNAIIPKERFAYNINELKKSIFGLCYMLAGLRNKFVNQHKLEVGLYLMASGATWEAINMMSTLGYSVCAKTVEEYRKQIQKEHVSKIENHFIENKNLFHVYNINDYHAIHKNRRPDTVSTSTANHFATCVAKLVIESYSVQLTFNRVSVYNPENVEASKICWYLLNVYIGAFDISYTDRQSYKISQGLIINTFDPIEMLTIHSYADNIVECKEERSMRGLQLVGFREQHLHSEKHSNSQQKNYKECQENKPTKKSAPKNSTNKTSTKKTSTKKTPTKASAKAFKKKPPKIYQLATLNEEVDLRYLPTAYSTSHPPHPELCDCCGLPLSDDNSMVYVCGHGYHVACYNKKCKYCEEYYKRGIFENVNSFLKRIEKRENKLTKKDLDDDENDIEEGVDEVSEEIEKALDTSSKLAAEIYNIEHCVTGAIVGAVTGVIIGVVVVAVVGA
ncbi:hypothetical protein C2G38_2241710 [Gigaspora rosea]|uniref:Uncharacterized protein n=1 Tax=Gigaspora rosea TaxID=44941 RepID=A0A397VY79_9GLOM|nr:hypothetical protein C2G38_2241710 [Gigaspora rosea]